jgi:hypothetical protein
MAQSVADVEGRWTDSRSESGLIQRCRQAWNKPVSELTREELATFLRQRIALSIIIPEARRRLSDCLDDDSEMYDGELANMLRDVIGDI